MFISHIEVERRDIHGYGDAEVVGIDSRQGVLLLGIADRLMGASRQTDRGKEYIQDLSHC